MRRLLSSLLLLVLLLPVLVACGAGGDTASPSPGTGEASPSPAMGDTSSEASPTPFVTEPPEEGEASPSPETPATDATPDTAGEATTPTTDETAAAGPGSGEGIRVGLVTDVGRVNDGTFNQFAYEGLQRAQQELGVEIDFIETQQPTDYDRNLDQFASQGYDVVIGVGFLMGDAIQAAASRYPDVNFAIVDFAYEAPPENLKGLVFREDQAAYMVGAMAALMSESGTIGVVGGEEIPPVQRLVEGYRAGANAIAQEAGGSINVQEVYIPSFTDPARGAEAARSQIAEGADVIFGAGGQTGSGAIQAAAQEGVWVIGVDQDEYNTTFNGGSVAGADRLITSALKRVDNAVYSVVEDVVNGTFNNELYVGTAENGGVDYAECHDACDAIPQEVLTRVEEIKQGLADGSIETGVEVQ